MIRRSTTRSVAAVTGPRGFIGSRVVAHLAGRDVEVRGLVRGGGAAPTGGTATNDNTGPTGGFSFVAGDLRDTDTLDTLLDGATEVIHTASYIGADPEEAESVNVDGTRQLVAAAERAGARVTYVSTASVFGSGPHRGHPRDDAHPESVTSRTRFEAERIVLDGGGSVVRPHLVYGSGDRWLFPGAVRLISAVGARPDTSAVLSAAHVDDLADAIVSAVSSGETGVLPVHRDPPLRASTLAEAAFDALGVPLPDVVPVDVFRERAAGRGLGPHQLSMLLDDNWFDADDGEPRGVIRLDEADREWYRRLAF